ncbi:MAG: hypothetical protein DWH79_11225 [Planctomycetota bacterium]|nr:MAG: hypothetical protein DWH79_11225 [Planctomycetota bacterium]
MPSLERITIYPVKSLDGIDLESSPVLPCGALEHDRRWRLIDEDGRVVNAKRTPLLHGIRAAFDLGSDGTTGPGKRIVALSITSAPVGSAGHRREGLPPAAYPIIPGPAGPCDWLSEALGQKVLLEERPDGGFPDDRDSPGATLVATASLAEVGRWFSLPLDEVRRRFRVNLEVGGCDPFWEDTLASPARQPPWPTIGELDPALPLDPYAALPSPEPLAFMAGAVRFAAVNVCRRCPVPSRDSSSGRPVEHFREAFESWRRRRLRQDVDPSAWGGLYRLAINTLGDGRGGSLQLGDSVVAIPPPSRH